MAPTMFSDVCDPRVAQAPYLKSRDLTIPFEEPQLQRTEVALRVPSYGASGSTALRMRFATSRIRREESCRRVKLRSRLFGNVEMKWAFK